MPDPAAPEVSGGSTSRVHAFDTLRVVATVGVVLLHGGAGIIGPRYGDVTGFWTANNAANLYDSMGRFAVNCFFMISGALLLAPEQSFRLVRQARRVAIPLAVWSLVYVLADAWLAGTGRPVVSGSVGRPDLGAPLQILHAAVSGPVAYHLWFVYALLGIYLVVPLLRPVTRLAEPERRRLLLYGVGLWLVFQVGVHFADVLWHRFPSLEPLALPDFPTGYLGVFVLGFVLHRYRVPGGRWLFGMVALLGLAWTVLAIWREQAAGTETLWGYDNLLPPVLLLSAGMFLLAIRSVKGTGRLQPAIAFFSRISFRVYLLHALVLHGFRSFGATGRLYHQVPVLGVPVVVALTVVVSFAVAWLVELVRPLRAYV